MRDDCGFSKQTRCPKSTWIEDFYKESHEVELASNDNSFLGVSIGCNKAYDAIDTARMGMRNPKFDRTQWAKALAGLGLSDPGVCKQKNSPQFDLKKDLPPRIGEMHCVEPMPMTFQALENATQGLNLGDEGFVVTKEASSRDGSVPFPKANTRGGKADIETSGLDGRQM